MINTRNPDHCLEYRKTRAAAQRTFKNSQKQHWKSYEIEHSMGHAQEYVWHEIKAGYTHD